MKVLKFGGSSVGSVKAIEAVADIVKDLANESRLTVVLSAMQGTTDALIDAGRRAERGDDSYREVIDSISERHLETIDALFAGSVPAELRDLFKAAISELSDLCEGVSLIRELSPKTQDRILSFGEIVSSRIVSELLKKIGIVNSWADSRQLIRTDSTHGYGVVDFEKTDELIKTAFGELSPQVIVMPGFIASDAGGATTTLGRGGSDYTAAIVASAVGADSLEIWTDVSGMMSADPRFVKNARHISQITYREAMELSHFGAKVIYPPTIQPVMAKGIPLYIKNTFEPHHSGTLVVANDDASAGMIRGISSIDRIAVLNLEGSGMVGIPGFSKRLFDALSRASINVILITQSSSEHSICVAIEDRHADLAKRVVDDEFEFEIAKGKIDPLKAERDLSILALVGDNMRSHTGISGKMFTALGQNGINITAIAQGSSERNISAIISSKDVRKAVNTLHEEFFSDGSKQVNVFIAGVGTVGRRLLSQIEKQHQHLIDELGLNLRVIGIAKSKNSLIDEEGIDLANYADIITEAPTSDIRQFTDKINELNYRNSVFVDVTAEPDVVTTYPKLLERSVSIIACNKVAASDSFDKYQRLKSLSREYGANFFFETNVGAGLPIIHTLGDLLRSGDRVTSIEAVLSGTLNFVFNNYDGSRKFAEVVRQAQDEGYTEPDPRLDLSGKDVARKILILAREAGYKLEMDDIRIDGFLPEACLGGSVEDFYAAMENEEQHFKKLLDDAAAKGQILKFIASFDNGKASVGLQSIGPEHNFANLSGKDNAVLFYTDRYADQPLVIKGAGAGADVTAAGVFADIIRASR